MSNQVATTENMSTASKVSKTATQTMKTVIGLLGTMDKHELNKSQTRIKIGSFIPKLRAEYGATFLTELKRECGSAHIRASISIGTLNVWACIAMFAKFNPAIEKLTEKQQRKFATLYDATPVADGKEPELKKVAHLDKMFSKVEFPKLRELAEDDKAFFKAFGVKNKTPVVKVTESAITGMFTKLRKMNDEERNKLIALIKKELAVPLVPKAKVKGERKGTKHTMPTGGETYVEPTAPTAPAMEEKPEHAESELVPA